MNIQSACRLAYRTHLTLGKDLKEVSGGALNRQFRDLRNASGHDRFTLLRTVDCGKTKSETVQVIGRRDFRFATRFDGREEFAHRAVESTRKPGSGKLRCLSVLATI